MDSEPMEDEFSDFPQEMKADFMAFEPNFSSGTPNKKQIDREIRRVWAVAEKVFNEKKSQLAPLKNKWFVDSDDDENAPQGRMNTTYKVEKHKEVVVNDSHPRSMNFYEPIVANVDVEEQLQCSHVPYFTDDVDYDRVAAAIMETYENGIHGVHADDYECSVQIIYNIMKELLSTTKNPDLTYFALYRCFRNFGTQSEFSEVFPKLVRMFALPDRIEQLLKLESWKVESKEEKGWPIDVKHPCSEANFFKKLIPFPDNTGCRSNACYHKIPVGSLINSMSNLMLNGGPIEIHLSKSEKVKGVELSFLNLLILQDDENIVKNFCNIAMKFKEKTCVEWFIFLLGISKQPNAAQMEESLKISGSQDKRIRDFKEFFSKQRKRLGGKAYRDIEKEAKGDSELCKKLVKEMNENGFMEMGVDVTPCCHIGPCGPGNIYCSCEDFCSTFCQCDANCKRKFPGCNCNPEQCGKNGCPCYDNSWECLPNTCKKCLHPNNPSCNNFSITRGSTKKFEVKKSSIINGNGMFAMEDCQKDEYLGEYTGERISEEERTRRASVNDWKISYDFGVPQYRGSVDSIRAGNEFRFVNHSEDKDANCYTVTLVSYGRIRIGFFAKEKIKAGSELFFDYNYSKSAQRKMFRTRPEHRVPTFQYQEIKKRKINEAEREKDRKVKKRESSHNNATTSSQRSRTSISSRQSSSVQRRSSKHGPSTSTAVDSDDDMYED